MWIKLEKKFVLLVILALIVVPYLMVNQFTEPHPPTPKITSVQYARTIASSQNGSISTLFFHTFYIDGSNVTFAFSDHTSSFNALVGQSVDNVISIEKVNQSMGLLRGGDFLLSLTKGSVEFRFNNTAYQSVSNVSDDRGILQNESVLLFGVSYSPPVNFTLGSTVGWSSTTVLSSYNVTYSIDVIPIIEYGPIYVVGKSEWLSHTFEVPYQQSN